MIRHHRLRLYLRGHLGCLGCSVPLLAVLAAITAAEILLTGCGSTNAGAKPASCLTQYKAWQHSAARGEALTFVTDLQKTNTAAGVQDIPQLAAALKRAGADAAALQQHPMPACADPARYWHQALTEVRAAADNANAGAGIGALMTAMAPAQKAETLIGRLGTELQHTVPSALSH
jgi:hypothetical protein